jgi:hypothetical protein
MTGIRRAPGFGFGLVRDDPSSVVIESVGHGTGELVIPEEVCFEGEMRTVRQIGRGAFIGAGFTKVIFPRTLEIVGQWAFKENRDLAEVAFVPGNALLQIFPEAFWGCKNLACVSLPPGISLLGDAVFERCPRLTTVTMAVGAPLKLIGDRCFGNCNLEGDFIVPSAVRSIGILAFRGNRALRRVVAGPESQLRRIGDGCFSETAIAEIALPLTVKHIGSRTFAGTGTLRECGLTFGHAPAPRGMPVPRNADRVDQGPGHGQGDRGWSV